MLGVYSYRVRQTTSQWVYSRMLGVEGASLVGCWKVEVTEYIYPEIERRLNTAPEKVACPSIYINSSLI